jgi:hypothetical protein
VTMGPGPGYCAGCGTPLRRRQGAWCPRCRQQGEAAPCPGCGGSRLLLPGTGRCATCSRTCTDCGKVVRPRDRARCSRCHRRAEPSRTCRACGNLTVIVAHGLCDNCWQQDPVRLAGQAGRLAARLDDPPAWLDGFAAHAAARHCADRTSRMISRLCRLLAETGTATPQAILEQATRPGQSAGTLARALEDFFTDAGLAFPADHAARRQAARRQRRIQEIPEPLRPAVARCGRSANSLGCRSRNSAPGPHVDSAVVVLLSSTSAGSLVAWVPGLAGRAARWGWAGWGLPAFSLPEGPQGSPGSRPARRAVAAGDASAALRPGGRPRTLCAARPPAWSAAAPSLKVSGGEAASFWSWRARGGGAGLVLAGAAPGTVALAVQ